MLKNIFYMASYYSLRGILQLYAIIINQIEMGIQGWELDFSEERALVLLPYALTSRRDRPAQRQGPQPTSRAGSNPGRPMDTAHSRVWFCQAYQRGECSRPDPHWTFVPDRGPVMVQHFCVKCYLTQKKKLPHPEKSCPCPSAGGT